MAKRQLSIKKGDTFLVVGTYVDNEGNPVDITNIGINSQVRDLKKRVIADIQAEKENQNIPELVGKYILRSQTNTWPIGELSWDIQYTIDSDKGDFIQSTETIVINVLEEITIV